MQQGNLPPRRTNSDDHRTVEVNISLPSVQKVILFVKKPFNFVKRAPIWRSKIALQFGKFLRPIFRPKFSRFPWLVRIGWALAAALVIFSIVNEILANRNTDLSYKLSGQVQQLVGEPLSKTAGFMVFDDKTGNFEFNQGYRQGQDINGEGSTPKYSASFSSDPKKA